MPKGKKGFQKGHHSFWDENTRKRHSKLLRGRPRSKTTRKKISLALRGKPKSESQRMKMRAEGNSNWKGGRKKNRSGYILLLCPTHHEADRNGYAFEHRIVAEKKIGRLLETNEVVHHLNYRKDDNRPENLKVMSKSDHISLHTKERFTRQRA